MNEPSFLVLIFTCISIISIIVSCTVIVTQADKNNIKPLKALYERYFKNDFTLYNHIASHKAMLLKLCLVPFMLPIAVFLINQLGMGNLKIRLDIQNFFNASFLATLAYYFIVSNKEKK